MPINMIQFESEKTSSVWVINKTSLKGTDKAGPINLSFIDGSGKRSTLQIKLSIAPQDLSLYATKKALMENPDFRRLHSQRYFDLLGEKEVQTLLQEPSVKKEYEKNLNLMEHNLIEETQDEVSSNDEIGAFVIGLIGNEEEKTESEIIDLLDTRIEGMSQEELKFIVNKTRHARVKTKCAAKILNN